MFANVRKTGLVGIIAAALAVAALVGSSVHAQSAGVAKTVGQTTTLSWIAPIDYTDGNAIPSTVAITYNVYSAPQTNGACAYPNGATQKGVTTLTYTTAAYTAPGVYCYAVSAVTGGMESALSSSITVSVVNETPNGVSGLTAK